MIAVKDQATGRTDMRPYAERLLYPLATAAAILRGEASRNRYDWHAGNLPVVAHPPEEQPPTGIADTLCQMVILDQTSDMQVFKGNHVVRQDQRSRLLASEIFTPPLDFQMLPCQ